MLNLQVIQNRDVFFTIAVVLIPQSYSNFVNDRLDRFFLCIFLQAFLLFAAYLASKKRESYSLHASVCLAITFVLCYAALTDKDFTIFWFFPCLFINQYFLKTIEAAVTNVVCILVASHVAFNLMGSEQGFMFSLVLLSSGLVSSISQRNVKYGIKHLEKTANIDALTNVSNRRGLTSKLHALQKEDSEYAVLIVDVDDFKKINDTFGHVSGDEALTQIAFTMQRALRKTDSLYRVGGEEFVVIIEHASLSESVYIAEKLRREVEEANILPHTKVTISIGVALSAQYGRDSFSQADKHLYQAKRTGKNRVICGL